MDKKFTDRRSSIQRLKDAIYEIKFAEQPGVHDNGEPRKSLTVEQALDQICDRVGIGRISILPLYSIDWEHKLLYSRVSGNHYNVQYDPDIFTYFVQYGTRYHKADTADGLIDIVAKLERAEPPIPDSGLVPVGPPWRLNE